MTLFKFICVQYQFHGQTLPIMKIDRGQIQFRDYAFTGTEPNVKVKVTNFGTHGKVLSQGIYICNMNALPLLVRKLWPRLKFFKVGQTSRSRSQGQNLWYL